MKLKVGDKVVVIAGKNKGSVGTITHVLKKDNKVVVEGVNMIKRHTKPTSQDQTGGIIEREAPIHASNVMILDAKTNAATRIGYTKDKKGNKVRVSKKSNEILN